MENTPLKKWREAAGLKATEVAARLSVTPAMWSRWETGYRPVSAYKVADVSGLTGIPPHELRPDVFKRESAA